MKCQLQLLLDGRIRFVSDQYVPSLRTPDMIRSALSVRLSHNLPRGSYLLLEGKTNGRDRLILPHQIHHHVSFPARVRVRVCHFYRNGELLRCSCSPQAG